MQLPGKTVLVTGAGRGIGRAIALALAHEGAKTVCVSRTVDELAETVRLIENAGGTAHAFPCDITDRDAVGVMVRDAANALGAVDILVNNAGVAEFKPFHEMDYGAWQRTFAVNLDGVFHVTQAVLPSMMARRSGRIINISSVAGLKPLPQQSAYVASKHALNGLSLTLALELREYGIAVHALCPGGVATRLAEEAMPSRDKTDWMTPEDIAHAVLYLATMSPRMTTDVLHVRRFGSAPLGA